MIENDYYGSFIDKNDQSVN